MPMLDVRTLFVVMVATSVLLAVSLWIATGRRFQDGLGTWTMSLVIEAIMFGLFSARDEFPLWFGVVVPNALFILCVSLQAAAILEFHGRRLDGWWHLIPLLLLSVLFALTLDNFPVRTIMLGVFVGTALIAVAFMLHRLSPANSPAGGLMVTGYLAAALVLYARALLTILDPKLVASNLLTGGVIQSLSFLVAYAVILITAVGFLLLHRERAEAIAQRLALTDPLTGTFNRRTFIELAEKEIARSRRAASPLTLIMLDLDHFKRINDRHGHLTGDMVLRRFSEIAQSCLRKEDMLVRYGGEEFCILLPDVPLELAFALAERIRKAVEQAGFRPDGAAGSIPVTVSAGVARLREDGMGDIVELVRAADEALYCAKADGRNRVVAYPENATIAMLTRSQRLRAIKPSAAA